MQSPRQRARPRACVTVRGAGEGEGGTFDAHHTHSDSRITVTHGRRYRLEDGTWHSNVNVIRSYYRQQTESTQPSHSSTYTETHDTTRSSSGRLRPYQSISECRLSSLLWDDVMPTTPPTHTMRVPMLPSPCRPLLPPGSIRVSAVGGRRRGRGGTAPLTSMCSVQMRCGFRGSRRWGRRGCR